MATSPLPFGVFPADHLNREYAVFEELFGLHCLSAFSRLITKVKRRQWWSFFTESPLPFGVFPADHTSSTDEISATASSVSIAFRRFPG